MKKFLLATITAFTMTSAASAAEFNGFLLGAEGDAYWDVDAEDWAMTVTPYAGYTLWNVNLTAETEINMRDIDFTGVDLKAAYPVNVQGLNIGAYGKISADTDFNFGGAKVGVEFKF